MKVTIIGAGLAGCEASYYLAQHGIEVDLIEQKPNDYTDAHTSPDFAELVCSNSLRSDELTCAVGLLKAEMRSLGSLIIEAADSTKVPAGGALAVDRNGFSGYITSKIQSHPKINIMTKKVETLPDVPYLVIASGPLTNGALANEVARITDSDSLHFYDAIAPIIDADTIDMSVSYKAARYGKGGDDYINCPMTREEYDVFYNALIAAEGAEVKGFEGNVFEGCMPIEEMARRGHDTMLFGPLKPVGLPNPHAGGTIPYAVVQLRQDNATATLYNIVGFQTHLKFAEQKRVFSLIPGLCNAEIVRYGVMHRNTFINSPAHLDKWYKNNLPDALPSGGEVYFAGQITGVEGYVESSASGLAVGINIARQIMGKDKIDWTPQTAMGALGCYVSNASNNGRFQPMNINFGIMESLNERIKSKQEKNLKISQRALDIIENLNFD
ncbi:MAG: methylenetetrahydrofolate--tRNA-(uracil(54)-C(5))-methyltransferase (FADH(2)-oxidizing) TrmFO [Clostridiales bacterium]|jgi:methylenetetrahydrofolate--tRNA-(uracil-5-)-methyltransferase|nr:methylenetetrahydrofolate--tRNA-(uracil(54)-C(5))-methyltransferase (FADH(2)-oxidizing) TrmFO [Clostridiales bacterium]